MRKASDHVGFLPCRQRGWCGRSLALGLAVQLACHAAAPSPLALPPARVREPSTPNAGAVAAADAGAVLPREGSASSDKPAPDPELELWIQDDTLATDCPRAPGSHSPHARLAPPQLAQAWRETLRAWAVPEYFARWRATTEQRAGAPYRRGRMAFLFVEERPNRPTRVWLDARHLQLPRELRADTPEQASTLLIGFSQCFAEYPPGQPPEPPSHVLWVVGERTATLVQLPQERAIGRWALGLPKN